MIGAVASALLVMAASQAPAIDPPPPGLQFGFGRMAVFRAWAHELRCGATDLDRTFDDLRGQLVARFGEAAFKIPEVPKGGGPGDCRDALSLYRVNMEDWRREVAAALAQTGSTES
jgi:hypothetical protein